MLALLLSSPPQKQTMSESSVSGVMPVKTEGSEVVVLGVPTTSQAVSVVMHPE